MSKNESRAARPNLKPVADDDVVSVNAGPAPKVKKPRKPRASGGTDFASQARALVQTHRDRLSKLVKAENKAETRLAQIKAQREAAEGPLREVEEILARRPELSGLEAGTAESLARANDITEAVDVNQ